MCVGIFTLPCIVPEVIAVIFPLFLTVWWQHYNCHIFLLPKAEFHTNPSSYFFTSAQTRTLTLNTIKKLSDAIVPICHYWIKIILEERATWRLHGKTFKIHIVINNFGPKGSPPCLWSLIRSSQNQFLGVILSFVINGKHTFLLCIQLLFVPFSISKLPPSFRIH
jgi:hypothetical protein